MLGFFLNRMLRDFVELYCANSFCTLVEGEFDIGASMVLIAMTALGSRVIVS